MSFVPFLPEIIIEGAETFKTIETLVEGGLAGQGAVDLATTYAKQNPDSKLGALLNDHSKHTPKVGNHSQHRKRRVG